MRKKVFLLVLVICSWSLMVSQEFKNNKSRHFTKQQLSEVKFVTDLTSDSLKYINVTAVEIILKINGSVVILTGDNNIISTVTSKALQEADSGSKIFVDIRYLLRNSTDQATRSATFALRIVD